MATRLLDIEDTLQTPGDQRFIVGIFNYCNRRCGRCRFSDRCRLFADEQRDLEEHPDDTWQERVHRSFQRAIGMIQEWCSKERVDVQALQADTTVSNGAEDGQLFDNVRQDPVQKLAEQYTFTALKLCEGLRRASAFNTWPVEAHEALETIEWLALPVSSKLHRALLGCAETVDQEEDAYDPVQSDWNGSAKVARLNLAESRSAWHVLMAAGQAAPESPIRQISDLLDRIDGEIAVRFPHAMRFTRPGFDDPEPTVDGTL